MYVEPDTDEEGEEDYEPETPAAPSRQPPRKRQKIIPRTRHVTRSKAVNKSKALAKPSLKGIGKKRRWNTVGAPPKKEYKGPSDGKIPDWTSLPIDILRQVFDYASQPRHEQTRTASGNVDWLLKTARVCRAFTLPALEAYYQSPSLLTNLQPHHLLELLQMPAEKRYMNYNAKVKSLCVDVRRLAYTATGRGLFDVSLLVAETPQLQHLEILHPMDEPPFRPMKIQNWHYPLPKLFEVLDERGIKLKSWRWNRDMIAQTNAAEMYELMARTHTSKAFEYLERLTVCGYDWNDSAEPQAPEDDTAAAAPGLATSIALLPTLKDLTFISCEVLVNNFLERLPKTLQRLEITNCLELTADMLRAYLSTSGSQLKELVLNHNPALNLSFLPSLRAFCPQLEVLKMDLRYYSERINSNDAEPLYDELLSSDSVSTWPSSLRHIELLQLQRWEADAAQNLFRSLVESAAQLPDLRFLVLHTHINIPWRQRAEFRDQWIDRLQRIYARRGEAPNPHLGSLKQFRLWKDAQAEGWEIGANGRSRSDDAESQEEEFTLGLGKKVRAVQVSPVKDHEGDTDVFSDSSPEKELRPSPDEPSRRRSQRVAESARQASLSLPTSDSEEEEEEDEADEFAHVEVLGLCDVVDIRIDNQRPREDQFTERDFLDAEISGDEDWQEGNEEGEDERYAW
jgi:hypothetical protein